MLGLHLIYVKELILRNFEPANQLTDGCPFHVYRSGRSPIFVLDFLELAVVDHQFSEFGLQDDQIVLQGSATLHQWMPGDGVS